MENAENKAVCAAPGVCPCWHHKIMPVLVVLFGLTFLLQAFFILDEDTVAVIWPVLVVLGGIVKLIGGSCKCYLKHY